MNKTILGIAMAALTCAASHANLIGTSVNGSFQFGGVGPNLFSPSTATVSGTLPEFTFNDGFNLDTVDLSSGGLVLKDVTKLGGLGYTIKLTDSAFSGLTLTEASDNFLAGGATATLVGSTITITVPTFVSLNDCTFTAKYTLTGTSRVPDNGSTLAMLAGGLGLLIAVRSRKAFVS